MVEWRKIHETATQGKYSAPLLFWSRFRTRNVSDRGKWDFKNEKQPATSVAQIPRNWRSVKRETSLAECEADPRLGCGLHEGELGCLETRHENGLFDLARPIKGLDTPGALQRHPMHFSRCCNATQSCVHTKLVSWHNFRTLLTLSRSTKNWNRSIREKRTSSLHCNAPGVLSPLKSTESTGATHRCCYGFITSCMRNTDEFQLLPGCALPVLMLGRFGWFLLPTFSLAGLFLILCSDGAFRLLSGVEVMSRAHLRTEHLHVFSLQSRRAAARRPLDASTSV